MLRQIKAALGLTAQHWKMVLFLYIVNLVLGLAVAQPFYSTLMNEANGSMALNALLPDFNFMVFTDFMRLHGKAFRSLFLFAFLLGMIYVLLTTLFAGSVFAQLRNKTQHFNVIDFTKNGFPTFRKYFLLVLIELLVLTCMLFLSGIFYFIFVLIADGGNERDYVLWMIPPTALMLFCLTIVVVICDYARIIIFSNQDLNAWQGFTQATTFVFRHFKTVGLYWIFIGMGIAVGLIYLFLDNAIGMSSTFTVILMFIIQQAVVFARVFLKTANYGLVEAFYSNFESTTVNNELQLSLE